MYRCYLPEGGRRDPQPVNVASARVAAALGLTPELDSSDRFGGPVRIHRVHNLGQGAVHASHG
jgi:hypothetical protein